MKKILNLFASIICLLLITLFTSCEKDLYDDAIIKSTQDQKQNFTFEYLYNEEARKITDTVINQIKTYSEASRSEDEASYGTIKYDEVMKVVDNLGNKTFMFRVEHPDATNEKFYNVVLQEKTDGNRYVKLFEYIMTPDFAEKYYGGLKEFKDFEGSYSYRLLANSIMDPRYNGDSEGGNSGSSGTNDGNTGTPTGPGHTAPGSNIGSNNNSAGVGSLNTATSNPCIQGGGPLGTGSSSSSGPGDGGSGLGSEDSSSCFIMIGNMQKVYTSSTCYYHITYMYVDCGGNGNRGTNQNNGTRNRSANDADPCNTNNNGVTIFQPSNAPGIFQYELNYLTGNTNTLNTFNALNPEVKAVINNYIAQSQIAINNAATFFSNLYHNNQLVWFSQQPVATQINIINYNLTNGFSQDSQVFTSQMINYLIQNPNSSVDQYKNWFGKTAEGTEYGDYDSNYWDNPNLTFQQQQLPSFDDFFLAYPSHYDDLYNTSSKMYNAVGGVPLSIYNSSGNGNTCALRVSKGLLYSGVTIPNIPGKTFLGADGNYYFLGAANLLAWMKKTFGTPTHHFTGAQGGTNGVNFPSLLQGINGIYIMIPNNPGSNGFGASGHADILDSQNCDGGCYFGATGGVKDIFIWDLP